MSILAIVLLIMSGIIMIHKARALAGKEIPPIWYNPYEIYDYITLTKEQNGRIGIWFWVFTIAFFFLLYSFARQ